MEAQRKYRSSLMSHSLELVELGFEPGKSAPESHVSGVRLNLRVQMGTLRAPAGRSSEGTWKPQKGVNQA